MNDVFGPNKSKLPFLTTSKSSTREHFQERISSHHSLHYRSLLLYGNGAALASDFGQILKEVGYVCGTEAVVVDGHQGLDLVDEEHDHTPVAFV